MDETGIVYVVLHHDCVDITPQSTISHDYWESTCTNSGCRPFSFFGVGVAWKREWAPGNTCTIYTTRQSAMTQSLHVQHQQWQLPTHATGSGKMQCIDAKLVLNVDTRPIPEEVRIQQSTAPVLRTATYSSIAKDGYVLLRSNIAWKLLNSQQKTRLFSQSMQLLQFRISSTHATPTCSVRTYTKGRPGPAHTQSILTC